MLGKRKSCFGSSNGLFDLGPAPATSCSASASARRPSTSAPAAPSGKDIWSELYGKRTVEEVIATSMDGKVVEGYEHV
jgi:hypothetical protein